MMEKMIKEGKMGQEQETQLYLMVLELQVNHLLSLEKLVLLTEFNIQKEKS